MTTNILSIDGTPLTNYAQAAIGGMKALGVNGNKFAVFSLLNKQVSLLGPSDLKEMNLKAHFGAKWCEEQYTEFDPRKETMVFNHRRLANDIITDCQAAGTYSQAFERRTGVWQMDDGQLVINGHELWRPDGEVMEHGIHEGRVYPSFGTVGFDRQTPEASDDEVNEVLGAFGSLNWAHPLASELLLGWLGVATTAAALRRRPHVMLTGPRGCGKSTVLELVKEMLGVMCTAFTGVPTEAGLRQRLAGNPTAALIDEFEYDPSKKNCRDTLEHARSAYSLQEGDEGVVRGSVTGKAVSFRIVSPFLVAGISPGRMEPADISRWVVLEAKDRKVGGKMLEKAKARELGPKLARRFVGRWSVFQASEAVVRDCILASGGDGRMADTVGTLLASYWAFVSDRPATAEDAKFLVDMLGIEERIANQAVSDEQQCLEALTSRVVPFKVMDGYSLVTRQLSIGQAVELVCKDPTGQSDVVTKLAQLGLRVTLAKGKWSLYVANSHMHQELRKLFAGTKWAAGGWSVVLRRLPGGVESTQRIGASSGAMKVTVVDVPQHLLPADDEGDMLLAA
jgi:energy-coupling factor transporter ATP-binding protein EcfA2